MTKLIYFYLFLLIFKLSILNFIVFFEIFFSNKIFLDFYFLLFFI